MLGSLTANVSSSYPESPDGWFSPLHRVPRRDQPVRIWTHDGVDHAARFQVAHTDEWPSGASWVVGKGNLDIPFSGVREWSPDPTTPHPGLLALSRPPASAERADAEPSAPAETSAPVDLAASTDELTADEPATAAPPAIARELMSELTSVGSLLRRLPQDHLGWTPHASVPTLHTLSLRLVRIVARVDWILDLDYIEAHFEPDMPRLETVNEIVETFNANARSVESLASGLTPVSLRAPWRFERNGEVVARLPRGDALRQFGITPLVYHRGEAALLMTALGLSVPSPNPVWTFRDSAPGAASA